MGARLVCLSRHDEPGGVNYLLLVVGAGGVVGEGEHFPALRSEAGEAQPVGEAELDPENETVG